MTDKTAVEETSKEDNAGNELAEKSATTSGKAEHFAKHPSKKIDEKPFKKLSKQSISASYIFTSNQFKYAPTSWKVTE